MLKNSTNHYGNISISIHWLSAVLVISNMVIGVLLSNVLADGSFKWSLYPIHKTLGMCIFILVVMRLIWHRISPKPELTIKINWQINLAKTIHLSMYLGMILMAVTGYLSSIFADRPVNFFIWDVGIKIAENEPLSEVSQLFHGVLAKVIALMILIHSSAALWHHYVTKDDTLKKMLPKQRK